MAWKKWLRTAVGKTRTLRPYQVLLSGFWLEVGQGTDSRTKERKLTGRRNLNWHQLFVFQDPATDENEDGESTMTMLHVLMVGFLVWKVSGFWWEFQTIGNGLVGMTFRSNGDKCP